MPSTDTNLEPPLPCVKAGGNNQENSVKGKVLLNNIKQRLVAAASELNLIYNAFSVY